MFRTTCVDGIAVNEKVLAHYMQTTKRVLDPAKLTGLHESTYRKQLGRGTHLCPVLP